MHDINRTQLEAGWGSGIAGESAYEDNESAYEDSEYEYEDNESAYEDSEYEYEDSEYEMYPEAYGETAGPLSEADEMELATQLLEVTDDRELEQFIGKLFNKVKKVAGAYLPPELRNSLGGIAKDLAKKALPMLGNYFAPGIGGPAVGKLAQAFGLELEGLSGEDQEFEVARQYVRLVSDAAQEAANVPPTVPPEVAAKQGMQNSAEKHAPGLVAKPNGQSPMQQQRQGMNPNAKRRRTRIIPIRPGDKFIKVTIERG